MAFGIGALLGSAVSSIGGALIGRVAGQVGGGGGGSSVGPLAINFPGGREAIRRGVLFADAPSSQIPRSLRGFQAAPAQLRVPVPLPPIVRPPIGRTPIPIPIPGDLFGNGNGRPTRLGEILMRARAATGGAVSSRKIRDAVRHCGLDVAAGMFGLSVEDVCFVFIQRRRRRGGITASDMRRTRSTIRKINSMRKSLKTLRSR